MVVRDNSHTPKHPHTHTQAHADLAFCVIIMSVRLSCRRIQFSWSRLEINRHRIDRVRNLFEFIAAAHRFPAIRAEAATVTGVTFA